MIVGPNKGVFFVATALMCSAALYAAEISSPSPDPLRRVFVGEPNRLTLPPGFPETVELSLNEEACAPISEQRIGGGEVQKASAGCAPEDKPAPAPIVHPRPATGVIANGTERAGSPSLGTTVQAH